MVLPYTFAISSVTIRNAQIIVTVMVESGRPEMPLTFAENIAYSVVPTEGNAPSVAARDVSGGTATLTFTMPEEQSACLFKAAVEPLR